MPSCDFALWKCGKRPLRRWKTDIHGPMEKPPAFPQPANIVSHSSASMTVYAHSHSAYYGEYPSRPILIEREKREQKKKRERHPRPKPKAALPLMLFSKQIIAELFAVLLFLSLQVNLAYTFLQQFGVLYTHLLMLP